MKIGIAIRKNDIDYFIHKPYLNLIKKHTILIINNNTDLTQIDGFIIPGGYDINSKYYNEIPISCNNIDEEMDKLDMKIVLHAYENNKPLLGICRGLQSINVFLGGTLNQNILNHNNENHFIYYNNKYYLVNSFHHQSIKTLAPNFKILAKSLDNEIEIIKYKNIIGIQYHPELINSKLTNTFLEIFNDT